MKQTLVVLLIGWLAQACQLMSNAAIDPDNPDDPFSSLTSMKGKWEITSEVQVAFELFEKSEGKARIKIDHKGRVLKERYKGYYKEDRWKVRTTYRVIGQDSLEVTISDTRHTADHTFRGTFINGFLSVESADGSRKLEMRLQQDVLIKKIFITAPYKKADWEMVLHWEYERD